MFAGWGEGGGRLEFGMVSEFVPQFMGPLIPAEFQEKAESQTRPHDP